MNKVVLFSAAVAIAVAPRATSASPLVGATAAEVRPLSSVEAIKYVGGHLRRSTKKGFRGRTYIKGYSRRN
jgi:hypothetical protein